jgi:hypothetical protein
VLQEIVGIVRRRTSGIAESAEQDLRAGLPQSRTGIKHYAGGFLDIWRSDNMGNLAGLYR